MAPGLTPQEQRLSVALRILAILFAIEVPLYLLPALAGPLRPYWVQLPFVGNSVLKAALIAVLCSVAASDVRRFNALIPLIIASPAIVVLSSIAMLIWADTSAVYPSPIRGIPLTAATVLWGAVALEGTIFLVLTRLYDSARRAYYGLRYLAPSEFETLTALADVLVVGEEEQITPEEIGRNVDAYLAGFGAQRKWVVRLALAALHFYPLLTLHLPLPLMSPEERQRFLKDRFEIDVAERLIPEFWRRLVQAMIRVAQQMVYLGYYSDKRTFASVGFVPFSQRPRYAAAIQTVQRDRPRVVAQTPRDVDSDTINADVVVIGSGAAGAILSYKLAEAGREVLVLERGRHVDPSAFREDEIEMFSQLYADGALQLSRDFRFQVLQGMCVGGSTVVNNGVCFDLPDQVLRRWNDPDGLDAGLNEAELRQSFQAVRGWLTVRQLPGQSLNPGARKFVQGIKELHLDEPPNQFGIVEANIVDCLGCGYCNIGCAFGKKLSMLDTILPAAQRDFGLDCVRILAECRVERIATAGRRATAVLCSLSDGRKLKVRANTVIVAAGAINSSWLLMQSNIGGPLAGQHLCFNMGSPLTADFAEELHSYDGLQISHYFVPPDGAGFALETWFNPVAAQALVMPGWFEDHYHNMRRYVHMTCAGVVVGTRRSASVRRAWLGGADIDFTPAQDDLARMISGLKLAGRIFFQAGATRVMPATFRFHAFTATDQLDQLDRYIKDSSDLSLSTAHPQGGNALSRDPRKGVVDPATFLVHGFDNLHVCDASVFPSSITVNPQLTVMALAHYAARRISA